MDKLEEIARGNPAVKQVLDSIFEQNKRLRERVGVLSRNYEVLKIAYRKLEENTKVLPSSYGEQKEDVREVPSIKKVKFGGERTKTFSKTDYIIPPS